MTADVEPTPVQVQTHTWAHRTARDITAVIMATTTGLAILILTGASIIDAYVGRDLELSPAYTSLLTGTLGVMVGAIAAYLGGRANDPEPATQRTPPPANVFVGSNRPASTAVESPPGEIDLEPDTGLSEPNKKGRHAVDSPTEVIEPIRDEAP